MQRRGTGVDTKKSSSPVTRDGGETVTAPGFTLGLTSAPSRGSLRRAAPGLHSRAVLTVLAEGAGFVAVAKPPGQIVIPGRGRAAREITLRQQLEEQLGRPLLVVHRLDRGTSGVLLLATDAQSHRVLSRAFEHHEVVKRYWALVSGSLLGSGEIDRPLVQIRGGLVRVARAGESGGKSSRTGWRALERIGAFTIVEFRPQTGRLHQIRAHAEAMGYPLAVDPDYGGMNQVTVRDLRTGGWQVTGTGRSPVGQAHQGDHDDLDGDDTIVVGRPTLHAWSIKFPHPQTREPVVVEAPPSDDLLRAVALLRGARSGG